jgi:hypothetical protein
LLYQNWKLYQLHAFLLIIDSRIDELPSSLTKKIVAIIRYFINGLITTTNYNNLPIHDNDGEGQWMHRMEEEYVLFERSSKTKLLVFRMNLIRN